MYLQRSQDQLLGILMDTEMSEQWKSREFEEILKLNYKTKMTLLIMFGKHQTSFPKVWDL